MIDAVSKNPVVSTGEIGSQKMITTPACPKCGEKMKKRVARKGKNAGKEFWGCTDFPKCTGTLPL
jgi:restriction system protein